VFMLVRSAVSVCFMLVRSAVSVCFMPVHSAPGGDGRAGGGAGASPTAAAQAGERPDGLLPRLVPGPPALPRGPPRRRALPPATGWSGGRKEGDGSEICKPAVSSMEGRGRILVGLVYGLLRRSGGMGTTGVARLLVRFLWLGWCRARCLLLYVKIVCPCSCNAGEPDQLLSVPLPGCAHPSAPRPQALAPRLDLDLPGRVGQGPGQQFPWPVFEMAEYEFGGEGEAADLANVVIVTNLPPQADTAGQVGAIEL
jgi:hypothetical protein